MKSLDLVKDAEVPMLSPSEIAELNRLAKTLPLNPTVIIIGAGVGAASLSILEARTDAVIFSVDIMFPTQQPMYRPGERANLIEAGYWEQGRVIQVWGDSAIVGKHWPIKCDLLLIDGDHRYPAVKNDIQLWTKHVKPGGILALHDYCPQNKKPKAGVKQAVDEFIKFKRISLVHWLISFRVS
jgi:tRNA G37 N-methylase Trm5